MVTGSGPTYTPLAEMDLAAPAATSAGDSP